MSSLEVAKLYATFELDAQKAVDNVNKTVKAMVALDKAMAVVDSTSNRLQAEVNASNKSMIAAVQAVSKAETAFEKFDAAIEEVANDLAKVEAAQKAASKQFEPLSKLAQGWFFVSNAARDAAQATKAVFDAASEGARIQAAEAFFKNSGKDIEQYRMAVRGLVSDANLMKKANMADSMGISQDVFMQLARVAQAASLKTGQSFEYMFDSIIVGTARSSRLLLDNLGIIVSVEEANKNYAKSIGKTVEELSDQEKQIAFSNEVMRKSQGQIKELEEVNTSAASSFDALAAQVENTVDRMKKALADAVKSTAVSSSSMLKDLNNMIDGLNVVRPTFWSDLADHVKLTFEIIQTAMNPVGKLFGYIADKAAEISGFSPRGMLSAAGDAGFFAKHEAEAGAKAAGYDETKRLMSEIKMVIAREIADPSSNYFQHNVGFEEIVKDFQQNGTAFSSELDELLFLFMDFNAKFKIWSPSKALTNNAAPLMPSDIGEDGRAPRMGGRRTTVGDVLRNFRAENADLVTEEQLRTQAIKDALKAAEALDKEQKKTIERSQAYWKKMYENQDKAEEKADKAAAKAERNQQREEAKDYSVLSGLTTTIAGGGGLMGPVASVVAPMIGTAIGGPIGAIIGGLVPVLGALMDGLRPVVDLISALGDGLSLFVSNAFLDGFTAFFQPLTEALGPFLAALGLLVGSVLRPFLPVAMGLGWAVGAVVNALTVAITVISPFVELIASVVVGFGIFGDMLLDQIAPGQALANILLGAGNAAEQFARLMVDAAIATNNAIVRVVRSVTGQERFGKILDRSDFQIDRQVTSDNTDATRENTAAVRDLAREFRNLPQFYKAQGTMFAVQDAESFLTEGQRSYFDQRARASVGGRFRT